MLASLHRVCIAVVVVVALLPASYGRYICDKTSLGGLYPFCVNVPDRLPADNCRGKLPTILYLGGSGTVGNASDIETLTTYDGMGKLLANYRKGNTSQVVKLAAERFITIIPIAPPHSLKSASLPDKHYRPEYLDRVLALAKRRYAIDENRLSTVGYSMGSRGVWRYNVNRPWVAAAAVNVAGAAEKADGQYVLQDPAPPTFPYLKNIIHIPIRAVAGTRDTTEGTKLPKDTQAELVRLGSKSSTLAINNNDHEGEQTEPWTAELLNWLLSQRKGGKCRRHDLKPSHGLIHAHSDTLLSADAEFEIDVE